MRRSIIAMLAASLAFGLAACGGDDGGNGGGEGNGGETAGEPGTAPGFDGQTIRLGVLTPLSGPVAVIGEPLTAGNRVWFDAINEQGGIAGKYRVELVQEDTRYEPDTTVQRYQRIKDDVVAFTQVLGTAPTLAVLPQLKRDDKLAAPASLDAEWVRQRNLLPVGAPYQIQMINGLNYFLDEGDGEGKTVCALIQDDVYGEAGLEGLQYAAQQRNVEIATTQRYKQGDEDVTGQIQALRRADCEAVFLTSLPSDAGTIWGTAARLQFAPRWIASSPTWVDELGASPLAEYLQQTTWLLAEGTEWGDEEVPGMAEMVERVEKLAPNQEPDYYFAFGYNQARAMTALLEKAVELGDLSPEGILRASDELGTVSFDGLTDDYQYGSADERNPPRTTTIFSVDPERPFGLATLEYNFATDAAREFQFEGGEG
jgi:ABC-type branched-subunit amino acid transport system substrate-binding protein